MPLLFLVYLAFLCNAAWWHFVNNDDAEGYLVMPLRLLQTGSTGLDPFLFRRVEAGLGGNNYLYALPLSIFEFPAAHSVDFGLGSLLIALQVANHAGTVAARNAGVLAASLALALAVVIFAPIINLAPDLPAIALIYAAIRQARRLSRQPAIRLGEHVLFGLLLFALVCLRTSYIVPAFAVAAALYLAMLWTTYRGRETPPPLEGGGRGEGSIGDQRRPLPPPPSLKGRGSLSAVSFLPPWWRSPWWRCSPCPGWSCCTALPARRSIPCSASAP